MKATKKKELELFLIMNKGVDEFTLKELADRFYTSVSYVKDIMADLQKSGWQITEREGRHKPYYRFLPAAHVEQRKKDHGG